MNELLALQEIVNKIGNMPFIQHLIKDTNKSQGHISGLNGRTWKNSRTYKQR